MTNRNEELKDQQEKSSRTLQEVVQEVKDMTNEYHTAILKATEERYKCEVSLYIHYIMLYITLKLHLSSSLSRYEAMILTSLLLRPIKYF